MMFSPVTGVTFSVLIGVVLLSGGTIGTTIKVELLLSDGTEVELV